jgi:hypothetical protein
VASRKSAKSIERIEIQFIGGPLAGTKSEFVHPAPGYLILDMGRALYVRETTERYTYQEDWSGLEELRKQERERIKSI